MIKAVFFDFDGVITLDKKGSTSSANYIEKQTGLAKELFLTEYRKFGPAILTGERTHREIWPELCQNIGQELDYHLLEESFIATPINEEVVALMKELKASGYLIGLITDNKIDRMADLMTYHNWYPLFDVLAISAQVGVRKKEPAIFEYALAKAGVTAAASVFIDNTASNLKIPKELGYHTIYYDDEQKDVSQLRAELKALGVA